MSFFIKSDTLCPWSIDLKTLVRNRFDVLIDFTIESIKGGVREVYVMLCDGTTYHVTSIPSDKTREVATWLKPSFKSTLEDLVRRFGRVYYLHERGRDIFDVRLEDGLYVFGDHDGLSPHDEEILSRRAIWISLGPTPYMSWQAAVYVAYLLKKLNIT
ncbi:MAG: tRNA (pseudouridine-N1)-methyltransferase [Pyrobaculum sp.]